ncbi:MAG TPA: RHS repeat-associated core domain-containing protein, partial [Thermoanaerobaculia bacterium]|jgi:RHS repeat-associated protein
LQRISDASGSSRYLDITWGPNGRISAIQDNSGHVVQYTYNTNGTLASVTNPLGQVTTYTYVTGRFSPVLSQIRDHWGRVISDITWDAQGRLTSYTEDGETFTYTFNYNSVANQTAKTDSGGNRWIYPTDSDGLITEKRPPAIAGAASSFATYNSDGTVQLATDEAGVKTYYTYAGQGRVASVTKDYQGGLTVRFDYTYDTNFPEKVISIIPKNPTTGTYDPKWQGWQYDYYAPGSVAPGALYHVYRLRDDGVTTETMATYTYNAKGKVTSVTDAAGSVTDYTYDTAGNLSTVTGAANNDAGTRPVTTYGYDTIGRVLSVTDALTKTTSYTYDALNRVTTVTLPPPAVGSTLNFTTTYSYDNYDATTGLTSTNVTDPNAIVTKQSYDQFGRLRKSIDALSNTTAYTYTKNLLTSITDANGNTTSYEYDALKRLSATVFPDSARESYTYYADGQLKTRTDRKTQTVTYTYDAHKRLTKKTYPNASYVQYTYDGQKLTQVYDNSVSPAETHTFGYDTSFRVSSNTQAGRGSLSYTYSATDAVASSATTGGPAATYAYYPDGSLNTITWAPVSGQFKYAYRLNGQYQSLTSPNGQTRSYSYDDQGRLLQIANAHPIAGNLATFDYAYDLNHATGTYTRLGQRVSMTANIPSQSLTNALTKYFYDANYQLNQSIYPAGAPFNGETHGWTYDAIGNRLTNTVNAVTTNYTYQKIGTNPNNWQRLTSDGTNAYTYDGNGNTATRTGSTFGWDYENRLTTITGGASATYTYDYQGRRTSKSAGATSSYLYDGLNLVSETSTATTYYLHGPGIDEPLAMTRAGAVSYFSPDGLGSVNVVSDAAGAQDSYLFDAWGATRTTSESLAQPFRYTAREAGELDMLFYRARFHQPGVGRFLSEDLIRIATENGYVYVSNTPLMFSDPLGLCDWDVRQRPTKGFEWSRYFDHQYFYNTKTGQSQGLGPRWTTINPYAPHPGMWENKEHPPQNGPLDRKKGNVPDSKCQCVDSKIRNPGTPPNYCALPPDPRSFTPWQRPCYNCQTWVTSVMDSCN